MTANTDTPLFTIRLTGEGLHPHLIPASNLAQLLVAAEQTVLAIAAREHPEESEELIVGLAQVVDASIGFAFASNRPEIARSAYTELTTATANRLFRSLPARSLEGLHTLTSFSRQRNGRTQFWNGGERPILDLPPEFGIEVPAPEYQRGETVFHGRIERVGGVRPRVRLRVSDRQIIYGDITEEQSRELGSRLYSHTALRGRATWDAQDGGVVYFRVEEILHHERGKASADLMILASALARGADVLYTHDGPLKTAADGRIEVRELPPPRPKQADLPM